MKELKVHAGILFCLVRTRFANCFWTIVTATSVHIDCHSEPKVAPVPLRLWPRTWASESRDSRIHEVQKGSYHDGLVVVVDAQRVLQRRRDDVELGVHAWENVLPLDPDVIVAI